MGFVGRLGRMGGRAFKTIQGGIGAGAKIAGAAVHAARGVSSVVKSVDSMTGGALSANPLLGAAIHGGDKLLASADKGLQRINAVNGALQSAERPVHPPGYVEPTGLGLGPAMRSQRQREAAMAAMAAEKGKRRKPDADAMDIPTGSANRVLPVEEDAGAPRQSKKDRKAERKAYARAAAAVPAPAPVAALAPTTKGRSDVVNSMQAVGALPPTEEAAAEEGMSAFE